MRLAAVSLLFCLGHALAQNPAFRAETSVIEVPVSVIAPGGRTVEGLQASDFLLRSDGIPQQITLDTFDTGVAPISLVIAIETSAFSAPALVKIRRIAGMIQPVVTGAQGEVAVVTFDKDIHWLLQFSKDPEAIEKAVKNLKPGKATGSRLFDAVAEVAAAMNDRKGRKLLLLISESRDRSSKGKFLEALETVQKSAIEVFGAHYSAYSTAWIAKPQDVANTSGLPTPDIKGPDQAPGVDAAGILGELFQRAKINAVQGLAQATGGTDYSFLTERGIEKAIERFGEEVHSQYFLTFTRRRQGNPKQETAHRIEVSLPKRPDVLVKTRGAWWD